MVGTWVTLHDGHAQDVEGLHAFLRVMLTAGGKQTSSWGDVAACGVLRQGQVGLEGSLEEVVVAAAAAPQECLPALASPPSESLVVSEQAVCP